MKIRAQIFTTPEIIEGRDTVEICRHLCSYGVHTIIRVDHEGGKENFWKIFNFMFKKIENRYNDIYIFTPDDFLDIDIDRIKAIHERLNHEPYAYNIINDGRNGLYNGVVPIGLDEDIICGFVDCGFFCNREALDKIGYYVDECKATKDSSGVGRQLSKRLLKEKVVMYKPIKSLASHGDHESIMHPEERKINPLKSL